MSKDDVKNKDGGVLGYIYFPNATYNQVPVGYFDRFYGSENPNYGAANGMIHMVGYAFDYDDIKSIMATIYLDFEKHKKDWLVIKADSAYIEKYRGQIQELANNISFKVILIY